jgi:hypothetical protein
VKEKRCKTHGKRNTTRVSRIRKGKIHRDKTPKQALAKKKIKPKALRVFVVEFARAVRCQKKKKTTTTKTNRFYSPVTLTSPPASVLLHRLVVVVVLLPPQVSLAGTVKKRKQQNEKKER